MTNDQDQIAATHRTTQHTRDMLLEGMQPDLVIDGTTIPPLPTHQEFDVQPSPVPSDQPLTIDELLAANQSMLEHLAQRGVRVSLNDTLQEFLLIALVDKIIGPTGTPEREVLDLSFQQHISQILHDTITQVALAEQEQQRNAATEALLEGITPNRAQRRQQARQGTTP